MGSWRLGLRCLSDSPTRLLDPAEVETCLLVALNFSHISYGSINTVHAPRLPHLDIPRFLVVRQQSPEEPHRRHCNCSLAITSSGSIAKYTRANEREESRLISTHAIAPQVPIQHRCYTAQLVDPFLRGVPKLQSTTVVLGHLTLFWIQKQERSPPCLSDISHHLPERDPIQFSNSLAFASSHLRKSI